MLTITHIDTDHIDGAMTLLLDEMDIEFGDIWFNGRNHAQRPLSPVAGNRYLGGVQGQVLSAILDIPRFPWNTAFRGRAIVVDPAKRSFPTTVIGGLTFTILSPRVKQLKRLAASWDRDIVMALKNLELIPEGSTETDVAKRIHEGGFDLARKLLSSRYPKRLEPPPDWEQGTEDGVYLGDNSEPNGSSIAFLVENEQRDAAVLFTGDAHSSVLAKSVVELLALRGTRRLRLDALKLPHHGSQHNVTPDLLAKLKCPAFLFSSDGSHGYDHPDDETIKWILADAKSQGIRPALYFNYLSHKTKPWRKKSAGNGELYDAHYPEQGEGEHGLIIQIG